jgi:hypothetical protein
MAVIVGERAELGERVEVGLETVGVDEEGHESIVRHLGGRASSITYLAETTGANSFAR